MGTEEKLKSQKHIRGLLMHRLAEQGYADVTDFWRRSKIQVSHETVRRALHGGKPTSVESFIKIAVHLGVSKTEIADMAKNLGDNFWPRLLSDPRAKRQDIAVLSIIQALVTADPSLWDNLLDCFKLLAKVASVDISRYLVQLKKDTIK